MAKRKQKRRSNRNRARRDVRDQSQEQPRPGGTARVPRFTVAMATYNRAEWVGASIQSVLQQSFED
ncbi:MAG: hypothetical protein ACPGQS_05225, partial [Bradymonadia bacterium]